MGEWIKVSERLPEENGTYLVVGKSGTPHTAHFYNERTIYGKTISAHFSNRYVTHWQFCQNRPKRNEPTERATADGRLRWSYEQ